MADGAPSGLASSGHHQRGAFLDAAHGHVGDKSGSVITKNFHGFHIFGCFDDAPADRLCLFPFHPEEYAVSDTHLRYHVGFNHPDPRRPFHRAEVLSGSLRLVITHELRESNHHICVGLSGIRALAGAVLEVGQCLQDIRVRETREIRVYRPAFSVGVVAE